MLVKYGIKVELFNLRFVEMIIHCSSFFFFLLCLAKFMFGTFNAKTILLKDK